MLARVQRDRRFAGKIEVVTVNLDLLRNKQVAQRILLMSKANVTRNLMLVPNDAGDFLQAMGERPNATIPFSMVIGPDGTVLARKHGALSEDELVSFLAQRLR